MKNLALPLLLSALIGLNPANASQTNDPVASCLLKVGWEEWYPFIYKEAGKLAGSEYELVSRIASQSGCQLEFVEVAWDASLKQLAEGKLDMLYGASMTSERKTYAQFSDPYRLEQIVLVVTTDSGTETDPGKKSLSLNQWLEQTNPEGQPRKLGLIQSYYYGDSLEPIIRAPAREKQLVQLRWDQKLHKQLESKTIDGYLIEASVVQNQRSATVKWLNVQEFKMEPLHLMFSKNVPAALVERFNRAINGTTLPAADPVN